MGRNSAIYAQEPCWILPSVMRSIRPTRQSLALLARGLGVVFAALALLAHRLGVVFAALALLAHRLGVSHASPSTFGMMA